MRRLITILLFELMSVAVADVGAIDGMPLSLSDRLELQQVQEIVAEPKASEHPGRDIDILAAMALHYGVIPEELRATLLLASKSTDIHTANTASAVLAGAQQRIIVEKTRTSSDLEQKKWQHIEDMLADVDHFNRADAGRLLVTMAQNHMQLPLGLHTLMQQALTDADPRVSKPVQSYLEALKSKSQDAKAYGLSTEGLADFNLKLVEALEAKYPQQRLAALESLRDLPRLDKGNQQLRMEVLNKALSDVNPAVRNYASFALQALQTGDRNAYSQVYVGSNRRLEQKPVQSQQQLQTVVSSITPKNNPGFTTDDGMFVSRLRPIASGEGQSMPSEVASSKASEGYYDKYGVFVGATIVEEPAGGTLYESQD